MPVRASPLAFVAALSPLLACALRAQRPDVTTVRVLDQRGAPVPHAVLDVGGGSPRIADDSGRITMHFDSDTTTVRVRRMGFSPYFGPVGRALGGEVTVTLTSTAQQLAPVTVETKRDQTPLERTGFYDRVYRAQRGAGSAEFVSPEELDAKIGLHLSDVFLGRRFIKVTVGPRGGSLSTPRATCSVTVLLDGQPVRGSASAGSIMPSDPAATKNAGDKASRFQGNSGGGSGGSFVILEELADLGSVAAIEMYASASSVPVALIPASGDYCAVVAIWTGSRH